MSLNSVISGAFDVALSTDRNESFNDRAPRADDAPDTFVRIEDKFLLPRARYASFLARIESKMDPSYPSSSTRFTRIESIYFDSEELNVYLSHFSTAPGRFKLRMRRYFPNGVPYASETHLELKSKESGISKKTRFKVSEFDCSMLQRGMPITVGPELTELNPKLSIEKLTQRVGRVNRLLVQYKLRPKCAIRYTRKAYEEIASGVRLTVDEKINYQLLTEVARAIGEDIMRGKEWSRAAEMRNRFANRDILLVEVKHAGTIPDWLQNALKEHDGVQASFSKYCYSVTDRLTETRAQ